MEKTILMERLEWPDMLVREQTYHAIKDFLIKNCNYKDVFIIKLKTQILESKILDLLVIVYLVNQEIENYFEYNLIVESINKPSFLSEVIITHIFKKSIDNYKEDLWYKNYSLNYPREYINKNTIKQFCVDNELDKLCKLCNNKLPIYDWFYYEYDKYADIFYNNNDYQYFYDDRYRTYANIKTLEADIQRLGAASVGAACHWRRRFCPCVTLGGHRRSAPAQRAAAAVSLPGCRPHVARAGRQHRG